MRRRGSLVAVLSLALVLLPATVAHGQAAIPSSGQIVPMGSTVGGDCFYDEGKIDGRVVSWEVSSVIPAFRFGAGGGVELAPPAEGLPRFAEQIVATGPFMDEWLLEPRLLAMPSHSGGCNVQSFDPLQARTLEQAGPHELTQVDSTVHFDLTSDPPPPQACAENDASYPQAASDIAPPPDPQTGDKSWYVTTFCNKVTHVGFYVSAKAACPTSGDMSKWPASRYINQYAAGKRLKLPLSHGDPGGNACGPSSMLMAMVESAGSAKGFPSLNAVYDRTMMKPASQVGPKSTNVFVGGSKGVAFAQSMGWHQARWRSFGPTIEPNEQKILESLTKGPLVVSTAFGTKPWGITGGGHMIAVFGADARGNFIVGDPAGNFFATPTGHYNKDSCGYRALYPHYWLHAYVTGSGNAISNPRGFIEMGQRGPPARQAPTTPKPPPVKKPSKRKGRHASADASRPLYGSAFAVYDVHPGANDAPQSFWVQDGSGRRTGWIDGQAVEEIPGGSVSEGGLGSTAPAAGDETVGGGQDDATLSPRGVTVAEPEPGIELHVVTSGSFALRGEAWEDGAVVAADSLTGPGSSDSVASPALDAVTSLATVGAGAARIHGNVVSVGLACASLTASSCGYSAVVTAEKGRRTVTIAKASATLAGGRTTILRLKPNASGRALIARPGRLAATLVVSQVHDGGTPFVVRRQSLRY
jgi:hypothetical protein